MNRKYYSVYVLDIVYIGIISALVVARIMDHWSAVPLLLIAAVIGLVVGSIWRIRQAELRLSSIDYAVAAALFAEAIVYYYSPYKPNSFYALRDSLFLFLFYFVIRYGVKVNYQIVAVMWSIAILGAILSIDAMLRFYVRSSELMSYGFTDITAVKNRIDLSSLNMATGKWMSIFIGLLPFPAVLRKFHEKRSGLKYLLGAISFALYIAIVLSLSRGIYVATIFYILISVIVLRRHALLSVQWSILIRAVALLALTASLKPLMTPILDTVTLFNNASQVRSYEGRIDLWRSSVAMIKNQPIFGVGQMNYAMYYLTYRGDKDQDDRGIVSQPFNIILQLLCERGVIGFIAYGGLFICFLRVSCRKAKDLASTPFEKTELFLFAVSVGALLIRDMSYSSILTNKGVGLLMWLMFAICARSLNVQSEPRQA